MSVPVVRHFFLSLGMGYDWSEPYAPYCPRNLVFGYRPPAGYPYVMPDLWMFVLLIGTGREEFSLEVSFRGSPETDPDDAEPEFAAVYGPFAAFFGADEVSLPRAWHLRAVPFDRPGWYEFRFLHDGVTLAVELVYLED